MPSEIHAVLGEHNPRPTGDPAYVPYWAKGEYARRNNTKYTTEEGSTIESGRVVKEGHGSAREALAVYRPQAGLESGSETPRKAQERHSARVRTLDLAATLVSACEDIHAKRALARQHGIEPGVLDGAPNAGVASMRLVNALRRKLQHG